jgi:osmotically inducible protein OsmC
MTTSAANARWTGDLKHGRGIMRTRSGSLSGEFSAVSRFDGKAGTTPEEMIGAAQAGCFAMALSAKLTEAGFTPRRVDANADVHLDRIGDSYVISRIELHAEAEVDDLTEERFLTIAQDAKDHCPVAQALRVPIDLQASLVAPA